MALAWSKGEKGGVWQEALELYSALVHIKIQPDLISCNAAAGLGTEASKGLKCGAVSTVASKVLSALAQGNWQMALEFFQQLGRRDLDVVSYGAALSACDRASFWERALSLLADLQRRRLLANAVICNTAMSACAKAGQWGVALQMLAQLLGGKADVISFNCAMAASAKVEEWCTALGLLSELPTQRLNATLNLGLHGHICMASSPVSV